MNLPQHFRDFLKTHHLQEKKMMLLVSGGVDSTVMLEVATQVHPPEKLAVFHLNHKTGKTAEKAEKFVQKICSKKGVVCYVERTKTRPESNKENAWRKERQRLAKQITKDFGAQALLTAHHATDLVETMIFRLTKGCGVEGLSPFDTSTKPFWNVPKLALVAYAESHGLDWIEDETNANLSLERNRIRHKVLPQLRHITPNLEKVFVQEAQIFKGITDLLKDQLPSSEQMPLEGFQRMNQGLKRAFLRSIAHKTPSFSEVEDCLKWLDQNPKGNSEKEVGGRKLTLKEQILSWK